MRTLPSDITSRLSMTRQTRANNADPRSSIWVSRPTIPLTDQNFIERQTVSGVSNVSDVSIAVCHPKAGNPNTETYLAYISNGVCHVLSAKEKYDINAYVWEDTGVQIEADTISLTFDGTMPKTISGEVEFVTEKYPWLFWVKDGVLSAQQLYSNREVDILAEANCTDVSAIRAMWSKGGSFDFGLVAFFIVNGYLYYKQFIDGVWYDAEMVSISAVTNTWNEIAAFRTWDYRVGIQGKTTTGDIYEVFTQFMGIGKQNSEHISINSIDPEHDLIAVKYYNTLQQEHLSISSITSESGAWLYGMPEILSIYNTMTIVQDEETGETFEDWGRAITVVFDRHINPAYVSSQPQTFVLVDSRGVEFTALTSTMESDKLTLKLTFTNFNNARGLCHLMYRPGTIQTMADYVWPTWDAEIEPINLNPTEIPIPVVEELFNL